MTDYPHLGRSSSRAFAVGKVKSVRFWREVDFSNCTKLDFGKILAGIFA
jgi:hypothetical protein